MVSRADAARLRMAQRGIRALVERDLAAFFGSLNLSQPERSRDRLLAYVPLLVAQYGESAAALAADWFDDQRSVAGVRGRFTAALVIPDQSIKIVHTVRRAAGLLFTDAPSRALVPLHAKAPEYVLESSRETIAQAAVRDPQARGWQRVTSSNACEFCTMLAGRGAVYNDLSVHFEAHGACNCVAAPSWGGA